MDDIKSTILDWLRDAHAMEQQAENMLSGFADRLEHYPELKSRIESHAQVSVAQQDALEDCINRAGGKTSALKDLGGKAMGLGQAISGLMVSDEVVKGAMSIYVFTQMEVVSYNVLATAAKRAGDLHTLAICNQHLTEEVTLAEWLQNHIPGITEEFLARTAVDSDTAKR